jgi:DNA repair protein RecO (recombination protein O)
VTLHHDHGIVLRTHKLGEADRIVVILTPRLGKVRAVAKGIRKTTSRIGGRLEPPTHCSFLLFEGHSELMTISQAETVDHFRSIRDDLHRLTSSAALCEVADLMSPEREPNGRRYQMLLGALRALAANDSAALLPAFYLRLLASEGLSPQLDECVSCGAVDNLVAFDTDAGGVLCVACRRGRPISEEGIGLMRRILGGELGSALNEPESEATQEVRALATAAMEHHVERRLRAMSVIERGP